MFSEENLESLKEIFPSFSEDKLIFYLNHYPGRRLEGLVEIIINERGFSCGICFERDFPMESVISCPQGHFFCKNCARQGYEGREAMTNYKCFEPGCSEIFEVQTLESIICPKFFTKYVQSLCKKEVESSSIKLESCPECDYGVFIEEGTQVPVIECQYEFCRARSCRKCRKPAHDPGLLCIDSEIKERNEIDNKMSEAVIRKCPTCCKPFQKMEGCNTVTCVCGTSICYVCRTPYKNGFHERVAKNCSSYSNMRQLHEKERLEAERKALGRSSPSSKPSYYP